MQPLTQVVVNDQRQIAIKLRDVRARRLRGHIDMAAAVRQRCVAAFRRARNVLVREHKLVDIHAQPAVLVMPSRLRLHVVE